MHKSGQEETSENELLKRFTKQIQSHKTYQKLATMIIRLTRTFADEWE